MYNFIAIQLIALSLIKTDFPMPICQKCGIRFPNRFHLGQNVHNLSSRKFCLSCSPLYQHNTRSAASLGLEVEFRRCPRCNQTKSFNEFYKRRNKQGSSTYCKICTNLQTVERQRRLKQQAVEHKGGKCVKCGYSRYVGALEFHHIDPTGKDVTISHLGHTTFAKIIPELDKCILVCANCHREIHAEDYGAKQ